MCTWYEYVEGSAAANPGEKRLRKRWEISPFPRIRPLPGERATRFVVGASPRPPLSESGTAGISFAGDTEGRCLGRACHGRSAEGGRVAHRRAGAEYRAGHTGTGIFSKIHLDIIIITIFIIYHDRYRAELNYRHGKEWIEDGDLNPRSRLTIENRAKYHSISTSC